MMNKKAIGGKPLIIIFSSGIMALLFLSFFWYADFRSTSTTRIINIAFEDKSNNIFLRSYLSTPFGEGTIADLLIQSYLTEDYTALEKKTTYIIRTYFENEEYIWEIKINGAEKSHNFELKDRLSFEREIMAAQTTLPSVDPTLKDLKIELLVYEP